MAKTSTSFQVCYIDSKGEKQIKNINDLTFEERGSIEKMAILNKGKTSTIGNFTSALSAKKNDKGEIVRIGFPNLKVLYGPAGVASISVEALRKATVCPSLQNYVGLAKGGENIAPKFVESSGVAINSEETPTKSGAFAIVSTKKDDVSGFVSEDDFYNGVIVDNGKVASSVVTIKVNPSKADLMQGPKTPGVLRQKADEIRATQEIKANTSSILGVVSALNENGVSLTEEQKNGLLSSFEAFVIANKGLSKEDAEAMKLGLQEDIYNVGTKLGDIIDSNTEKVANDVASSKNEILDRLQSVSKKAEQTSANDRAVNFAEHSKTRTVVANEGKRTTQETVDALKEYLSSEDFARFVAESTPVDRILGGIEKITSAQNDDVAYLLQEVGVSLSAPQVQRLTEAFKDGLEDSATSTAKTVQDMITFATEAVKSQMTVDGVNLTAEQEKRFTEGLSKRFLEERILNEKTISDVVGKATSATVAKMDDVFARLDDELVAGFAMTSEDIRNTNTNVNRVANGLGNDHVELFAQGEQTQNVVANEGAKTREEITNLGNNMDSAMMGLRADADSTNKKLDAQAKQISAQEAIIKELQAQIEERDKKIDTLMAIQIRTENRLEQLEKQNAKQGEVLYAKLNAIAEGLGQMGRNNMNSNVLVGQNTAPVVGQNDAQQGVGGANNGSSMQSTSQGVNTQQLTEIINKSIDEKLAKLIGADLLVKPGEQNKINNNGVSGSQANNKPKIESGKSSKPETAEKPDEKKKEDKTKKVKVLKENVETMGMLAEPKLPWYKRMGKFIIRHPFRSILIGMGAGALVATGIGAIAMGGLAPVLATANAFAPTIAVGVGAGAGLGLVGSVVSRFSRKGRRERAYTKFMKKYNKALKKLDKVKEKDVQIATLDTEIDILREKHRKGTLLSKVGVYKACRKVKKQVMKFQKKRLEKNLDDYAEMVEKAATAKNRLNVLEEKSKKSNAVGGYLAKRDKIERQYSKGRLTEKERNEDIKDLDSELVDYYSTKQDSIGKVSRDYKTGDTEIAKLMKQMNGDVIKGRVKAGNKIMSAYESGKRRNTKLVYNEVEEERIPYVMGNEYESAKGNLDKLKEFSARSQKREKQTAEMKAYNAKYPERAKDNDWTM